MTARRYRPAVAAVALIVLGLALSACTPPREVAPAPPTASEPQGATRDGPRDAPLVSLRALPSLATPKEIEPEHYGPPVEPEFLVGLDRIRLQRAIGSPSLRRRESTAEVWQYQGETCVMDVFLYPDGAQANLPRVTYVELRRQGVALLNEPDERRRCYAEALAEGRRNAASGAKTP